MQLRFLTVDALWDFLLELRSSVADADEWAGLVQSAVDSRDYPATWGAEITERLEFEQT